MFLMPLPETLSLLRTSGDVSIKSALTKLHNSFAPHERRCFLQLERAKIIMSVCSARAEMFLFQAQKRSRHRSLLRTSGDVSGVQPASDVTIMFAPYERRCFLHRKYR